MKLLTILMLGVLNPFLYGCSYLMFWEDDDAEEQPDPAKLAVQEEENDGDIEPTSLEELDLKLAKVWSRVDELEEQVYQQKQKMRVLEKGLMLGIVPEEMQKPAIATMPPPPASVKRAKKQAKKPKNSAKPDLSSAESAQYEKMLALAHDHYRAGRYGRAIVEYGEIDKVFGAKIPGGLAKYWIARSWTHLNEYNTAHQMLVEFVKTYPKSPWVPRAKLDLARVELKQGLRETAIRNLRQIIDDYPYEDAAEMAKMELRGLEKNL